MTRPPARPVPLPCPVPTDRLTASVNCEVSEHTEETPGPAAPSTAYTLHSLTLTPRLGRSDSREDTHRVLFLRGRETTLRLKSAFCKIRRFRNFFRGGVPVGSKSEAGQVGQLLTQKWHL